ncbi:MAG: NCS1 family transporter [Alphaproteobacteria bacterium]
MSNHKEIELEAGGNHLIEESILPIKYKDRAITGLGYFWMWICMAVIIATFSLGAAGIAGLNLMTVALTIFFANLVLGVIMLFTADIGTEHGLSFAVFLRAPFGTVGTHLPSVSRGIVAAIWFGIQTYLGALALNGIVSYLTGFDNWMFWYAAFTVVQIVNTAMGIKAVEWLAAVAAPAIVAISIWMYYTLENVASVKGVNIWTFAGSDDINVFILFVANMSFWSALAVDIPNLTRFLHTESGSKSFYRRNKKAILAQFVALPITQAWVAVIGAISFMAAGDWNPINVIQSQGTGFVLVLLLVLVILAQWSTNTAANLIPSALAFVNAGAPKLSFTIALVIAGIVGTLSMPWLILNHLFTYLGFYGAVLSAVGGIMVCDYFFIRKRQLNVPELYKEHGQYRYMHGFNPAGLIAWVLGGGLALYFIQYAYIIGFPTALIIYYVLMKSWIMKKYPQAEVEEPLEEYYLATSVGKSWVFIDGKMTLKPND